MTEQYGSDGCIKGKFYESELLRLQDELVSLQDWITAQGLRLAVIFEGRDAAWKGAVIKHITQRLNARIVKVVALGIPPESEKSQWYFQRYVPHLPVAGEMVLLDRSWYNRVGVERVIGFCTDDEYREFLRSCPEFERMLVRSGTILIKYWFAISAAEQERRLRARISDPGKRWKIGPVDVTSRAIVDGLLPGQGRDVHLHGHRCRPVVRREGRCEASYAPALHPSPFGADSLLGSSGRSDRTPGPSTRSQLLAATVGQHELGSRGLRASVRRDAVRRC